MKKPFDPPALSAALITPQGDGGISVIAVWGKGALPFVAARLRRRGRPTPVSPGRLALALLCDARGEVLDEVIVAALRADYVEINCHGGLLPAARVLGDLKQAGVLPGDPRVSLCPMHPLDAVCKEALDALLEARTDLAARVLAAQAGGLLSASFSEIAADLASGRTIARALQALAKLQASAPFGIALVAPPTVVVLGPANAGKSSIVNRLAGYERNIVTDVPGTTRDAVRVPAALFGVPVTLIDTAGAGIDVPLALESFGQTSSALVRADAALVVVDAAAGLPPAFAPPQKVSRVIVAANKSDLPAVAQTAAAVSRWDVPVLHTCAVTGRGIPDLSAALLDLLGVGVPDRSIAKSPVVFSKRQLEAVTAAVASVSAGDPRKASHLLTRCMTPALR